MNMPRQVQDSLYLVDAGIRRYGSAGDLFGAPYFPPAADIVLNWLAFFTHGVTFGMYVGRLTKAFQMIGRSEEWRPSAVSGSTKGTANAARIILKLGNFKTPP